MGILGSPWEESATILQQFWDQGLLEPGAEVGREGTGKLGSQTHLQRTLGQVSTLFKLGLGEQQWRSCHREAV